ncbi:MAG: pyridoxamine 5'-phosphate oxidase family protein [Myxococcales bacterium]|nr:pyridoxamine 5'-phosphate oxidase family protein [Myxococcales bacterium]
MADSIRDQQALREQFGPPSPTAQAANRTYLDAHHQRFIRHSPFLCIASTSRDGQPNVSPRGDAPGFVHVADERTLVIPDRLGNNKLETFENVVDNPHVALIFFVPGVRETVRVQGNARIARDPALLELGRQGDRRPAVALVVEVTRAYLHCGKSLVRSRLWDPSRHVAPDVIPTFGQMLKDQVDPPQTAEEIQADIERMYREEL